MRIPPAPIEPGSLRSECDLPLKAEDGFNRAELLQGRTLIPLS